MALVYQSARVDLLERIEMAAPGTYTEREALLSLQRVEAGIDDLKAGLNETLSNTQINAMKLGDKQIQDHFSSVPYSEAILSGSAPKVSMRMSAYRRLAANRFQNSVNRYGTGMLNIFRRELMTGLVSGETAQQMTRRIKKALPPGHRAWRDWLSYFGGRNARTDILTGPWAWAERIVRTELVDAYNAQKLVTIQETNATAQQYDMEVRKQWSTALEGGPCILCQGFHGEIRKAGESFGFSAGQPVYKPGVDTHPNCRCVLVPIVVDAITGEPVGIRA